jgi:hypothetical protein
MTAFINHFDVLSVTIEQTGVSTSRKTGIVLLGWRIGELSKLTRVIYVGINGVKTIPNITKWISSIMYIVQSILS